jgi:uncharacterized protein
VPKIAVEQLEQPRDAEALQQSLEGVLRSLGRLVVAFSGGADSALLAGLATQILGRERVLCVTAVSPSLAPEEERACAELAEQWNLRWQTATTDEMANPRYVENAADRCYHCKTGLMDVLTPLAEAEDATVVLGVNLDDLNDHRPGQRAASERGAVFPFVEAGLDKRDVRDVSRRLGLQTADKPAAACLASRLPYGTPVTLARLASVAAAEEALHHLGFPQVRVRHHGEVARIELPPAELRRATELHEVIAEAVRAAGYRYATLDLDGYRSGRLNDVLAVEPVSERAVTTGLTRPCDASRPPRSVP